MNGKHSGTGGGRATVYTPLVDQAFKAQLEHGLVESEIPDTTSLFHAIEAFHQAPYPVLLARFLKTRGPARPFNDLYLLVRHTFAEPRAV